jgi:endonuclease YncB( thermonuclease family)
MYVPYSLDVPRLAHSAGYPPLREAAVVRDQYIRDATVIRVAAGSAFVADIHLGWHTRKRVTCRLAGLVAPDHTQPGGDEARTGLADILGRGHVVVRSVRCDGDRCDADVYVTDPDGDGEQWWVNGWMVGHGYAVLWDGTGPRPTVPWPPVPVGA